jgi:hypothetical protein
VTHQEAVNSFATERYLLGEMSDADRDAFEEHYFSCDACAQDVRSGSAMGDAARAVFAAEAVQRPKPVTRWHRSPVLPWALAASLAALATYQAVSPGAGINNPGTVRALHPAAVRALHPVTVRPESRGQDPVVRADPRSGEITLAIEINGAREGTDLGIEITDPAGRPVVSSQETAPPAGAPLLLSVDASALPEPARYELSIQDRATGQPLGTYRFVLSR